MYLQACLRLPLLLPLKLFSKPHLMPDSVAATPLKILAYF
jgi:hypothetical protein